MPHGGLRTFHRTSTCLHAINLTLRNIRVKVNLPHAIHVSKVKLLPCNSRVESQLVSTQFAPAVEVYLLLSLIWPISRFGMQNGSRSECEMAPFRYMRNGSFGVCEMAHRASRWTTSWSRPLVVLIAVLVPLPSEEGAIENVRLPFCIFGMRNGSWREEVDHILVLSPHDTSWSRPLVVLITSLSRPLVGTGTAAERGGSNQNVLLPPPSEDGAI